MHHDHPAPELFVIAAASMSAGVTSLSTTGPLRIQVEQQLTFPGPAKIVNVTHPDSTSPPNSSRDARLDVSSSVSVSSSSINQR